MHLATVLGNSGTLISVENRAEHAEVGAANMTRLEQILPEFPDWHLIQGDLGAASREASGICEDLDAVIIDMAEPWSVLSEIVPLLRIGGRLACYCPTTSQLERSWDEVESLGLVVEWSGEVVERKWTKASKGGVRPGNQPIGHTAFLLISAKTAEEEE
jgi:tRNA (adenine57-N1/adenine58-N1)-methyltransferase